MRSGRHCALHPRLAAAVESLRNGRPALLTGAPGRWEIVLPAHDVTVGWISWTVRHSSGLLRALVTSPRADRLRLPPMTYSGGRTSAATVSVDAADGITTGISARDRAHTLRLLAAPSTRPEDLSRPGHVLPVVVDQGPGEDRSEAAMAALSLCRIAGLSPVAVSATVVVDGGGLADRRAVRDLGRRHGVPLLDVGDVITYVPATGTEAAEAGEFLVTPGTGLS